MKVTAITLLLPTLVLACHGGSGSSAPGDAGPADSTSPGDAHLGDGASPTVDGGPCSAGGLPALSSNPSLWLRADALMLASGTPVTNWPSYAGLLAASATAEGAPPVYVPAALHGRAVVRFTGDALDLSDVVSSGAFTVFGVGTASASNPAGLLFLGGASDTAATSYFGVPAGWLQAPGWSESVALIADVGSGAGVRQQTTVPLLGVPHIYAARVSGNMAALWVDGVSLGPAAPIGGDGGSLPFAFTQVGWDWGWYSFGDIAEIVYYPASLADGDRTSVESCLEAKYSLPVSGALPSSDLPDAGCSSNGESCATDEPQCCGTLVCEAPMPTASARCCVQLQGACDGTVTCCSGYPLGGGNTQSVGCFPEGDAGSVCCTGQAAWGNGNSFCRNDHDCCAPFGCVPAPAGIASDTGGQGMSNCCAPTGGACRNWLDCCVGSGTFCNAGVCCGATGFSAYQLTYYGLTCADCCSGKCDTTGNCL